MSKTILTVVKLEWGKGYYKNGALVHYHKDKWEPMEPQEIIELYKDCDEKKINMTGAKWEYSGIGFPDKLEDALNQNFDPFADSVK